ncbi:unnamed protein product [Effrenium voratum]|nr:unnamed protein product [Effrenium voratum]CAJ1452907.1 unnamed protein product [Effrenium voratum]
MARWKKQGRSTGRAETEFREKNSFSSLSVFVCQFNDLQFGWCSPNPSQPGCEGLQIFFANLKGADSLVTSWRGPVQLKGPNKRTESLTWPFWMLGAQGAPLSFPLPRHRARPLAL